MTGAPLVFVFVAATVATLATLGWALAANWWRVPRFGSDKFAPFPVLPRGLNAHAPAAQSARVAGAHSPEARRD